MHRHAHLHPSRRHCPPPAWSAGPASAGAAQQCEHVGNLMDRARSGSAGCLDRAVLGFLHPLCSISITSSTCQFVLTVHTGGMLPLLLPARGLDREDAASSYAVAVRYCGWPFRSHLPRPSITGHLHRHTDAAACVTACKQRQL
jgi:hypothetical protein